VYGVGWLDEPQRRLLEQWRGVLFQLSLSLSRSRSRGRATRCGAGGVELQTERRLAGADAPLRQARRIEPGAQHGRRSPARLEAGHRPPGVLGPRHRVEAGDSGEPPGAAPLQRTGQELELRSGGDLQPDRLEADPDHAPARLDRVVP
jgi:hypothetical protein